MRSFSAHISKAALVVAAITCGACVHHIDLKLTAVRKVEAGDRSLPPLIREKRSGVVEATFVSDEDLIALSRQDDFRWPHTTLWRCEGEPFQSRLITAEALYHHGHEVERAAEADASPKGGPYFYTAYLDVRGRGFFATGPNSVDSGPYDLERSPVDLCFQFRTVGSYDGWYESDTVTIPARAIDDALGNSSRR